MGAEAAEVIDSGTVFSLAGLIYVISALSASVHVLLNKQDVRASFSWIGVIVLSPFFGVTLYWLFGINRIRRWAKAETQARVENEQQVKHQRLHHNHEDVMLDDARKQLLHAGLSLHYASYLESNHLEELLNGIAAYPAMLAAIDSAQSSVILSSYIFEYDSVGKQFVNALIAAHERGVGVQVLIDGVGVGYGFSLAKSDRVLRKNNVPTARFLPTFSAAGVRFINLRNHRKILSVDGKVAKINKTHSGSRKRGQKTRGGHIVFTQHAI